MTSQPLWVCGRALPEPNAWEIMGVYDNKDRAEAACFESDYFIGPVPLNEPLPAGSQDWPGVYYPRIAILAE